jgi:hypothetical protein
LQETPLQSNEQTSDEGETSATNAEDQVFNLTVVAGADLKTTQKISLLLAASHIQIRSLDRAAHSSDGKFHLGFTTEEDRDKAVKVLKRAGLDATVPVEPEKS